MTKKKISKLKDKDKIFLQEAARRFAQLLIDELEQKKNKKINNK